MSDIKYEPAFPQGVSYLAGNQYITVEPRGGMTILDYFAGQALIALYCSSSEITKGGRPINSSIEHASSAYEIAEAMLAERAKRKP